MRKVVLIVVPLLCLTLVVLLCLPLIVHRRHDASYYVPVVQGQVYRSRQPNEQDWEWLKQNLHIRTVVDLRDPAEKDPHLQIEPGELARLGVRHVSMSIKHHLPTDPQIAEFLAIVTDPANQPVLIHCELGRQRTGVMVALYRMQVQGWPPQQAFDEMLSFFKRKESGIKRVDEFLLNYKPRSAATQPMAPSGRDER